MKKFYLLFSAVLIAGIAFAQAPVTGMKEIVLFPDLGMQKTVTTDTVTTYFDRATAFYTLNADTAGYVLGTNSLSSETGVHYDGLGATTVSELMVFFGYKVVMGGAADSVEAHFYEAGADSMPATWLGSGAVAVDDIDVNGFATYITINNPGTAIGDFFVSIGHDTGMMDDTIAIVSSNPVGTTPDGMQELRTRQNTHATGWERSWDLWTINGPYDADAMIIPVVDFTVGLNAPVVFENLKLYPSYPNPSASLIRFPYEIEKLQTVRLSVLDAQGRLVFRKNTEQDAGRHEFEIDLNGFANGVYHFVLEAGETRIASKFTVLK